MPASEQAPCQLETPWGKAVRRPPATRAFPLPPAEQAPSQPALGPSDSEAVSPRAAPACLLSASFCRHTCPPQRRPGAGQRPRCSLQSRGLSRPGASGPAPPLAVSAPSRTACRARQWVRERSLACLLGASPLDGSPPRHCSAGPPQASSCRPSESVGAKEVRPRAIPRLLSQRLLPA